MLLERSPDYGLAVAEPRSMDERAPSPAAIAQLTVNDLATAGAELAVTRQPRRPDLSDALFRSSEGGSLFIRITRDGPSLTLDPSRRMEREKPKLGFRFSLGAHSRPASSSAAQRSAADQQEVRRPAAPPVHVLMAAHHRPRATRVRIPYAPPSPAWMLGTRMVACVVRPRNAVNARRVRAPVRAPSWAPRTS